MFVVTVARFKIVEMKEARKSERQYSESERQYSESERQYSKSERQYSESEIKYLKRFTQVTWVGVHNRRGDYGHHLNKLYSLPMLGPDFFLRAMQYFSKKLSGLVSFKLTLV